MIIRTLLLSALALGALAQAPEPKPQPPKPEAADPLAAFFDAAVGTELSYTLTVNQTPTTLTRKVTTNSGAQDGSREVTHLERVGDGKSEREVRYRYDGKRWFELGQPILQGPLAKDTSWTHAAGDLRMQFKVLETGAEVTVAAGTFKGCVVVQQVISTKGGELVTRSTYAPKVGLVRSETTGLTAFTAELTAVKAAAAPKAGAGD